jgi:hypothetical protein
MPKGKSFILFKSIIALSSNFYNLKRLLNTGSICTLPAYHTEHNLFPIGFKTVRSHASIFVKGKKCDYTCEILEG